jgi:hypothetical protein
VEYLRFGNIKNPYRYKIMTIQIIADDFNKEEFNAAAWHPLQTWEWGQARKETGVEVIRLGEFEGSNLKNVFQLTLHKIPKLQYKIGYLPCPCSFK